VLVNAACVRIGKRLGSLRSSIPLIHLSNVCSPSGHRAYGKQILVLTTAGSKQCPPESVVRSMTMLVPDEMTGARCLEEQLHRFMERRRLFILGQTLRVHLTATHTRVSDMGIKLKFSILAGSQSAVLCWRSGSFGWESGCFCMKAGGLINLSPEACE
jgi:hypothetical protein